MTQRRENVRLDPPVGEMAYPGRSRLTPPPMHDATRGLP
jgi:hypothetical protein